jgi:hypothetical protein
MSWAKKYYKITLCYLASLHLFWRGFLYACPALYFGGVRWVQLFYSRLFRRDKCAARVLAYKNHDKKVEGNSAKQHRPCILAVLLPCLVAWVWASIQTDDILLTHR